MKTIKLLFCLVTVVVALCSPTLRAAVRIGEAAPDFTVTDIEGRTHQLSAYKGRTVVLEWVNSGCPFVQKHYESRNIPKLQRAATSDGVVWLAINSGHPGAQGDLEPAAAVEWMKQHEAAPTAYIRDQAGKVGRLYGAKTTPQLFVINADGMLVYNGAIDSIRSANQDDLARARNHVAAALADLKAGRPIATPTSQPYGCAVKY